MDKISPAIREMFNRLSPSGEECEAIEETEWSYRGKYGQKHHSTISKFFADEKFSVSVADVRVRWPLMEHAERMDFAASWRAKPTWTNDDTDILEIVMQDGDEYIWSTCALALTRHPNRTRAVDFLIERIENNASGHEPLNYMQALGIIGDKRAIPIIRPYYDRYLEAMKSDFISDDVFRGPIPYHAFLATCGDLFRIDPSSEYEQQLRKYLDHPHPQVRWWASHALNLDSPEAVKRQDETE